jgi:hypothetical protein
MNKKNEPQSCGALIRNVYDGHIKLTVSGFPVGINAKGLHRTTLEASVNRQEAIKTIADDIERVLQGAIPDRVFYEDKISPSIKEMRGSATKEELLSSYTKLISSAADHVTLLAPFAPLILGIAS